MNADTVEFLKTYPTPADLRPYEAAIVRLPLPALVKIVAESEKVQFTTEELGTTLQAAADFGALESHRCAGCFKWVARADAHPRASMLVRPSGQRQFVFYSLCKRCAECVESGNVSEKQAANMRDYVFEGK